MNLKRLSLMFPALCALLLTLNCKDEGSSDGGAPNIPSPHNPNENIINKTPPPAGLKYTRLTFEEKLQVPNQKISALGRSGDGSYLYLGDRDKDNVIVAVELAANPLNVKQIPTCVLEKDKCAEHKKGSPARYPAAFTGQKESIADKTQIKSIVADGGKKAIFSLTGLISDQYYEWPFWGKGKAKKAQGAVLQIDGISVKGVWGNTVESLNTGVDSKEIASIATVGGSWVAYAADSAAKGSYRAFDEKPDKAHQSQVDNQGKIVTAAVGSGSSLYRALSDGSVRRLLNAESNLGSNATEDLIVDSNAKLKITGSTDTNEIISALGVVGTTLLVGLQASAGTKTGGVALVDLNDPTYPVTQPSADLAEWSVQNIALSQDGASALITTNGQGILFYKDGHLSKISSLAVQSRASKENPLEFDAAKVADAEKEGFSLAHASIGATNVGDAWYIATNDKGIFQFTAEDITQ